MTYTFTFTVIADPACWDGTLSAFEEKLIRPLPVYALEQLRARFHHAVTTTRVPKKGARSVLQLAFDTELGAVLAKAIVLAPDVRSSKVCERRRYLDIDTDMQRYKFMWAPALTAAREIATIPTHYVDLIETHLTSAYPRHRVSALATLLCLVAVALIEDA
jgi:hypothetical protein